MISGNEPAIAASSTGDKGSIPSFATKSIIKTGPFIHFITKKYLSYSHYHKNNDPRIAIIEIDKENHIPSLATKYILKSFYSLSIIEIGPPFIHVAMNKKHYFYFTL